MLHNLVRILQAEHNLSDTWMKFMLQNRPSWMRFAWKPMEMKTH